MRSLIIVILIITLALFKTGYGQHFNFQHYTVEHADGLSIINDITQDQRDNIWFATYAGAIRFDGKNFHTYKNEDGLTTNAINRIFEDSKGNIWFGTISKGIVKFDGIEFTSYPLDNAVIMGITEDYQGNLWVATQKHGAFVKYKDTFEKIEQSEENRYYTIHADDNGRIWLGGKRNKLHEVRNNKIITLQIPNAVNSKMIQSICSNDEGSLWLGTIGNGIIYFDGKNFKNIGEEDEQISGIRITKKGTIWASTLANGILKLEGEEATYYKQDQGLPSNIVHAIYLDRAQNTWIGFLNQGAAFFQSERFSHINKDLGLKNNNVFALHIDEKDGLFIGTGNGLEYFDGKKVKKINHSSVQKTPIICFHKESDNKLLIGTKNGYVIHNPSQNTFIEKKGLGYVFSITKDNKGNTWFATGKKGVIKYDGKKMHAFDKEKGLSANKVNNLFWHNNKLWVATAKGINYIQNDSIHAISKAEGLITSEVFQITADKYDNLWFATFGRGIFKYDGNNFSQISIEDGLNTKFIYTIQFDEMGNLIAGTQKGVSQISFYEISGKDTLLVGQPIIRNLSKADGFTEIECNTGAILTHPKTKAIYFGTVNGVGIYQPKADRINNYENKTNIASVKLFFEEVDWNKNGGTNLDWTRNPRNLELPHDQNHLSFEFIGINYGYQPEIKYQFKMEGLDQKWSPEIKKNEAVYSNIPPGTYEFKVRSCNQDGIWSKQPTTIAITINSPFWMRWWFILGSSIAVLGLLYSYIKIREFSLKKEQERLENQVDLRTQQLKEEKEIVEQQKQEIESAKEKIQSSIRYAKRIQDAILPHEIRFQNLFENSFVFYQPKDIVSGDFYWIEQKGDIIYFAAADCTGHGVPGAFMSIVCHNLLEQVVTSNNFDTTGHILNDVNKKLSERLRKEENAKDAKSVLDGMDIALCSFNTKTKELQFSGAHSPLFIYRRSELLEFNGDMFPIGSLKKALEHDFTTQKVQCEDGDSIYIFSDGYVDQMGGPKRKKFKYKAFRELLLNCSTKSPEDQKALLDKTMIDWQGDNRQMDDMLIVGVKV